MAKWSALTGGDGVVVGCDRVSEWMLKWWYDNYKKHNNYPVLFVDFGMSDGMIAWCKNHGTILSSRRPGIAWFNKPFALLLSSFARIIWTDIDCEIRGDLAPLFAYADKGVGVTRDPHTPHCKNADPVATGVIVAKHGDPIIKKWAELIEVGTKCRGDQEVFNSFANGTTPGVAVMPPEYQWLRLDGDKQGVTIMHWTGSTGKRLIRKKIEGQNVQNIISRPDKTPNKTAVLATIHKTVHTATHKKIDQAIPKTRINPIISQKKTIRPIKPITRGSSNSGRRP